jgi:pilus assembly protein Flp/PilA
MRRMIFQLAANEGGVTAIEYGLIAALVAIVCIAAWQLLGSNLSTAFNNIAGSV